MGLLGPLTRDNARVNSSSFTALDVRRTVNIHFSVTFDAWTQRVTSPKGKPICRSNAGRLKPPALWNTADRSGLSISRDTLIERTPSVSLGSKLVTSTREGPTGFSFSSGGRTGSLGPLVLTVGRPGLGPSPPPL